MTDISKSPTLAAEAKFAATRKNAPQNLTVREKAEREVAARTAKLKALRLARDEAEQQAAAEAAPASPPPKPKKPKAEKPPKRATRVY